MPVNIFSSYELDYIRSKGVNGKQTAAGIFAAKEAYFKAVGTGIEKSKLRNVEVHHTKQGVPFYFNDDKVVLSISHTDKLAVAVCVYFDKICTN